MPNYEVNEPGLSHARGLIRKGEVDTDTNWSDALPSTQDENEEIDDESLTEYGRWHLAVDPDASKGTKGRYRFPFGDFEKVNRAGVVAAKQRAAQNDHTAIEKAADELLELIDAKSSDS